MWWNLENLFDIENSPDRSPKLKEILKKELEGWNEEILFKKIEQLTKIISLLNNNNGPDFIGVCEVENSPVLKRFVDKLNETTHKNYLFVHEEAQDKRGIQVAFIYDSSKFELETKDGKPLVFSHYVLRREATRNILQANFILKSTQQRVVVIGNHWPSRTQGELESEPFRIVAGETLNYYHKRILEEAGSNTFVLVMGDFNDEPFNRSIRDYATTTNSQKQVLLAKDEFPIYLNLMWPLLSKGEATYYYRNRQQNKIYPNMLDQFLVSKGLLLDNSLLKVNKESVAIVKMEDMFNHDAFQTPNKFGRPSSNDLDKNGYSDHFPIIVILEENLNHS